jgi:hypothetical protein
MRTKMSFPNEIEKVKAKIKMLEKKLSFLEELERTKTPCEEAFKRVYGRYPMTDVNDTCWDGSTWIDFKFGYNAAQEDYKVGEYQEPEEQVSFVPKEIKELVKEDLKWCKEHPNESVEDYLTPKTPKQVEKLQEKDWDIKVETDYLTGKARHKWNIVDKDGNDYKPEPQPIQDQLKSNWEPKPQTEKQVEEGLSTAFREAVKQGVVSSVDKPENDKNFKNSLDLIKEWGEKNKPPTLKELLWEWWEDIFTVDSDLDSDASIDVLVDMIDKKFIPPSHDTNDYQWNKCLKIMREKLR